MKKSVSSYVRHSKAPYQYSELYKRWYSVITNGRKDEAEDLGRRHTRAHMSRNR